MTDTVKQIGEPVARCDLKDFPNGLVMVSHPNGRWVRFSHHQSTLDAANKRAEEAERKLADVEAGFENQRRRWRNDDQFKRLDTIRQNLAGLRPGDTETIADAQSRIVQAEARIATLEADRLADLARLCEATGVLAMDGHSSPSELFERCLGKVAPPWSGPVVGNIVERLRAPAYWMSGSSQGHEGENSAAYEAAAEIERLEAELDAVKAQLAEARARDVSEQLRVCIWEQLEKHGDDLVATGPALEMVLNKIDELRAALAHGASNA